MSDKVTYICSEGTSNKFWEYEIVDEKTVRICWGRVGLAGQQQVKKLTSSYARDRFIDEKTSEKIGKGYQLVTEEKKQQETEIAQTLGFRYKIQRLEFIGNAWAGHNGERISFSNDYSPLNGVFVEILQSWDKSSSYLLIGKNRTVQFRTAKAVTNGVEIGSPLEYGADDNFVQGVRKLLKTLKETVQEVFIQFGTIGDRVLSLDDDTDDMPEVVQKRNQMKEAMKTVAAKSAGFSDQVVNKFAALGNRELEI